MLNIEIHTYYMIYHIYLYYMLSIDILDTIYSTRRLEHVAGQVCLNK